VIRLVPVVLSLSVAAANDWPQFRGPDARGVSDRQDLPIEWSVERGENVLWTVPVPGLAHSSPVVWGDRVYLTTAIAEEGDVAFGTGDVDVVGAESTEDLVPHRWEVLALDKRTGAFAWRKTAHRGVPRIRRHVKASHASATPVVDGNRLVALLGSEGLFCFDLDGELIWRTDVGVLDVGYWQESFQWGAASSPLLYENLVIVQNDRQNDSLLLAYDLETGKEVWRAPREEKPAWSTPALFRSDGGDVIVTNGANWIRGNDAKTGEERWRLNHGDLQVITPTPLVTGDRVIVTGGNPNGGQPTYAIDPAGRGDAEQRVLWRVDRSSPYTPTPVAYEGVLYIVADNGILSAYDVATGERIYRTRLEVGAGFSASPVVSDGRIYFPSEDGEVFVVRASREYELLSRNDMGEPLMASPAISGGILFLRGRNHLFAVSRKAAGGG
jgi:outer membrane protein assembly factor BamB